jgi:hypothetical protein
MRHYILELSYGDPGGDVEAFTQDYCPAGALDALADQLERAATALRVAATLHRTGDLQICDLETGNIEVDVTPRAERILSEFLVSLDDLDTETAPVASPEVSAEPVVVFPKVN